MRHRRPSAILVAGLLTLAACGGSGTSTAGTGPTTSGGDPGTSSTVTPGKEVSMPSVLGLTETEARRVLADAGLDAPNVTSKKSFETPGKVLEQVPSAGRTVTGGINLTVAEAIPPVPNFVGKKIADVRAWAGPLGVDVRAKTTLTTEKSDGEVLDQLPAAGAQASKEIVVGVAQAPTVVPLSNMEPVEENYYTVGDINMNGAIYTKTVILTQSFSSAVYASFNLSRRWETLEVTLGLDDNKDSTASVQVEFQLDDKLARTETVVFGATKTVKLDVNNVLRLKITARQATGKNGTRLGLGNAKLIGAASTGPSTGSSTSGTGSGSGG